MLNPLETTLKHLGGAVALSCAAAAMAGAPVYKVEVVRASEGSPYPKRLWGINNQGEMVGQAVTVKGSDYWVGIRVRDRVVTEVPESADANLWGINDAGVIVGDYGVRGYRWGTDGLRTDIGSLGGDHGHTHAQAIDSAGKIVGSTSATTRDAWPVHAFVYDAGAMTDLGTLGGDNSSAADVNDLGQVAGNTQMVPGGFDEHAFIWQNGVMKDLGTFGGAQSTARAINASGHVVGSAKDASSNWKPFFYDGETMSLLPQRNDDFTTPQDINRHDEVVGLAYAPGHNNSYAFLTRGGVTHKLSKLLDASGAEWELIEATSINDAGQIVGRGKYRGKDRLFLATPLPR